MSYYSEPDADNWRYLEPAEMWYREVKPQDIRPEDSIEDFVKKGYWIKLNTPTHLNLAEKSVRLLDSWTQSHGRQ